MEFIKRIVKKVDAFQQRHAFVGFPFAVVKKFGEDRAGNLAALIAYYGFLSLFPLMLVMVSVLGLVLRSNPELREAIVNSALSQFPVIGDQLKSNIQALTGGGAGVILGIGTVGALWAGLGVMQATQTAMNDVWDIKLKDRPRFLESRLRGLIMLVVLGSFTLATTGLTGLGTAGTGAFIPLRALSLVGSLVLNFLLYMVAFRVLTDAELRWRDVVPGAIAGAIMWTGLQALGNYIVNNQVKNASELYGIFGFVIALLGWIYLGAQLSLYCAEINVVKRFRLWPRTIQNPPLNEADRRALRRYAEMEERLPQQDVDTEFARDAVAEDPAARVPAPPGAQDDGDDEGGRQTSVARLVGSIGSDARLLVRKQVELARQEVTEALTARVKAVAGLAVAGVLGLFVLLFLSLAAASALDGVLNPWLARALVAVAFVLVVGGLVLVARRIRKPPMTPEETKRTVQETIQTVKASVAR